MSSSGRSKWKSETSTVGSLRGCSVRSDGLLGHCDCLVDGGGHGFQIGCDVFGPGDGDGGEWLGDDESVPRVEGPAAVWLGVESSDPGRSGEFGEADDAVFGDSCRSARAVGGEGTDMSSLVGFDHGEERFSAAFAAGAADGDESQSFDGSRQQLSVEGAGDHDGDPQVAEVVSAGEEAAVPEGEDRRTGNLVSVERVGRVDLPDFEGPAQGADDEGEDGRNRRQKEALFAVEHGGDFSILGIFEGVSMFHPLPRMVIAKFFILNHLYTNPHRGFIAHYQT